MGNGGHSWQAAMDLERTMLALDVLKQTDVVGLCSGPFASGGAQGSDGVMACCKHVDGAWSGMAE
ncbi:hypothetical protein L7F22_060013, partial [Adiantum nelumboides]|nr:hypothetical protein [Adiantum nelumboides]